VPCSSALRKLRAIFESVIFEVFDRLDGRRPTAEAT
jgi:hypothetical protein